MTLYLLLAALAPRAWAAPLPPNARVLGLPASMKTEWVLPEGPGGDCGLAVDVAGAAWLGCRKRFIVGPSYGTTFAADEPFESLAWLEDGSLLGARGDSFGAYALRAAASAKKSAARLTYTRLGRRAGWRISVHRGAGQTAYLVASNAEGSDVILLSREGEDWAPRLLFSDPVRVTAVTGDGRRHFVAQGRRVLAVAGPDLESEPLFDHPSAEITQLEYDPAFGLFYATSRGAGFLGSRYRDEFIRAAKVDIELRKGSLYALFSTGAVLKIEGSGFARLDAELAAAGVPASLALSAVKPSKPASKPTPQPTPDPFAGMTRSAPSKPSAAPSGAMGFKDD